MLFKMFMVIESKVHALLYVSKAYNTRCIRLKLIKHWSEHVFSIEECHPYRQCDDFFVCVFYDDAVAMFTI